MLDVSPLLLALSECSTCHLCAQGPPEWGDSCRPGDPSTQAGSLLGQDGRGGPGLVTLFCLSLQAGRMGSLVLQKSA